MLARCAEEGMLVINPIIYAELSIGFERIGAAACAVG
jgi:hypothetical protein